VQKVEDGRDCARVQNGGSLEEIDLRNCDFREEKKESQFVA